jgi:acetyl-CoA carboxylase carboxyltransferase component
VATLKAKGKELKPDEEQKMFNEIKDKYDKQTTPYYAASRLWVDAIIDPTDTRKWISMGIEAANHAPMEKFNMGILQV